MPLSHDTQLISVDDHVVEPPHAFIDHIEPKYRDMAPRVVEQSPGVEGWWWEDKFEPISMQGNPATRVFREGEGGHGDDLFSRCYADMIPGSYDVHERVKCMDEDGVTAQVLFPQFPRFAGTRFLEAVDKDYALACVRAWNDWMIDEWCAAYPDRFIPQNILPLWDIPACVAEMQRVAAKGSRGIAFIENPYPVGLPSFNSGAWEPVFACAQDTQLVLDMHIGTSAGLICKPSPDASPSVAVALCGANSMSTTGDLLFSGQLDNYPGCRITLSEGGAGWVPYALERLDYTWERSRQVGLHTQLLPSEVFQRQFFVCMIADRYALVNRHIIGLDKIMWESDFPHNDSNWPNSRKVFEEAVSDIPDADVKMIGETNARNLYRFPA